MADGARPTDGPPVDDDAAAQVDRGAPTDAAGDRGAVSDLAPPDEGTADARPVDGAGLDGALPDLGTVDGAGLDGAGLDGALADLGVADVGLGDLGVPNPLGPRPAIQTCRLPEAPPLGAWQTEAAFPALSFERALWVGTAPGDDTLFVMEQGGTIWAFDDRPGVQPGDRSVFLRRAVSRAGNEEGLLGLAFHPGYAENGLFYVYYSAPPAECAGAARCSVVSEYRRANRRSADPGSERIVLRFAQPFSNHNGGDLHFGPDGRLYISVGDGGSGGDPQNHGQRPTTLLGSVLRIDVDDPPAAVTEGGELRAYRVPPDNPFVGGRNAAGLEGRAEVWAWGLRNVWRMAFDAATGALWAADVGQDALEEVNRIEGPGNFGWNLREGTRCYGRAQCPCADCVEPVHTYGRNLGVSITGGFVYRGAALPALWGRYLFADFASGRVWALPADAAPGAASTLLTTTQSPSAFGLGATGRLYLSTFAQRGVVRLVPLAGGGPAPEPLPRWLSETGCFADTAAHRFAAGVVPYDLNVPFWSDHAHKLRGIALPAEGSARLGADGRFSYPVGTLFLKTFELSPPDGAPARRLETRILARQAGGWRGYTWRWNAEQTDAERVDVALEVEEPGPEGPQTWLYPESAQCDRCHTPAAGHALGWQVGQLQRRVDYPASPEAPGGGAPQIAALMAAGYLTLEDAAPGDEPVPDPRAAARWPRLDDERAPVAARVRVFLDANCAACHQPGGPGNARLDLRATTAFADTGLCGEGLPLPGGTDPVPFLVPGAPEASLLWQRMARRGVGQMPPLGSHVLDAAGLDLLARFIDGPDPCP